MNKFVKEVLIALSLFFSLGSAELPVSWRVEPIKIVLPEVEASEVIEVRLSKEDRRELQFLDYFPPRYRTSILRNSSKYDIKIEYLYRIMFIESRLGKYQTSLKPNRNGTVDCGVMHLNSGYLVYYAEEFFEGDPEKFDVFNYQHSIQVATAYLRFLVARVGSLEGAFISYNSGPGNYLRNTYPAHSKQYARVVLGMPPNGKFINLDGIKYN